MAKPVTSAFVLKQQIHRNVAKIAHRVRNASESSFLHTYSVKEKVQKALRIQHCLSSVLYPYTEKHFPHLNLSAPFHKGFLNTRAEEKLKAGYTPIIATVPQPATK